MAVSHLKLHFTWRKSATKFLCVKTVSNKVVRRSLAYLRAKMVGGGCPYNVNFALSEPPLGTAAVCISAFMNLTNTVFASQWLECNIELLTVSINWTEVFGCITRSRFTADENYIPGNTQGYDVFAGTVCRVTTHTQMTQCWHSSQYFYSIFLEFLRS